MTVSDNFRETQKHTKCDNETDLVRQRIRQIHRERKRKREKDRKREREREGQKLRHLHRYADKQTKKPIQNRYHDIPFLTGASVLGIVARSVNDRTGLRDTRMFARHKLHDNMSCH